jgi:CRP-like cAMP-binding protein
MDQTETTSHTFQNRILSSIPKAEYARLAPHLEYIDMPLGRVLTAPHEEIQHVYFPLHGTISLIVLMRDGAEAEVGVIGREGMLGLSIILGTDTAPLKAMVQVPGNGLRIKAHVFREELEHCRELYQLLLRYAQAFFIQTAVTAACNGLHPLEGRLPRWLLMCQERAQSNTLQLTQEFISIMLGTRRATVTMAAGKLQKVGVIEYSRGKIRILDQKKLEAASCECYEIMKEEYDRLFAA